MKHLLSIIIVLTLSFLTQAQEKSPPSFEDILSLKGIRNPEISPDGQHVLFEQSSTDWQNNRYDREIFISKNGAPPIQLTQNPKQSSTSPQWSPDGQWIAYLANKGNKTQIQIIRTQGGESFPLTQQKGNITRFAWSPDGQQIAFIQSPPESPADKDRKKKFGDFAVEDQEIKYNQLFLMDFRPDYLGQSPTPQQMEDSLWKAQGEPRQLMDSSNFTINSFSWSPDGQTIAFSHQPDPLINSFFKRDISLLNLASGKWQNLVSNSSYDDLIAWSPDGQSLLYESDLEETKSNYYLNGQYFILDLKSRQSRPIAQQFDENIYNIKWTSQGIFGNAWNKTQRSMVKINPENGQTQRLSFPVDRVYDFSFSKDGKHMAFIGAGDRDLTEVYWSSFPLNNPKKISNTSQQIRSWKVSQSEVIAWNSKDGARIEGVLHKPQDYDPKKKYPLLVIIHGGPTGISTPSPTPSYVYPIVQWLNKGALVLQPNYRGSAGYGEAFRSLNVKNLGVGDAWDVLSGVKYLEDQGLIDGDKVGAMGWSQGGYISAFLTTHSNKFKAISVGAGISNWMTYYVNTDIHPFTRQYLKATPWSDPEIYAKTSPMTKINNAQTPTLIQHGEFDRRVPPANAFELYQGLQDVGVATKLVIYKGFGHGITKPKERLAAVWHNWHWFAKYIWGEEVEIPMK
ncbi:MAG: S9 family peptidase [Bacteroidota bacterium]